MFLGEMKFLDSNKFCSENGVSVKLGKREMGSGGLNLRKYKPALNPF